MACKHTPSEPLVLPLQAHSLQYLIPLWWRQVAGCRQEGGTGQVAGCGQDLSRACRMTTDTIRPVLLLRLSSSRPHPCLSSSTSSTCIILSLMYMDALVVTLSVLLWLIGSDLCG